MYKLSYGRTFNLGNYESERIDIEREYDDDTPEEEAIADLKATVLMMHRRPPAESCDHDDLIATTAGDTCMDCGTVIP